MDLLLCRQWGVEATLEPKAALQKDFASEVIRRFRLAAPLVDALNTPLCAGLEKKRRPLFGLRKGHKSRENPGNWGKSWKNKPKTEQIAVFRLTNAGQSRIVNGGGFVFTRINTGFPDDRCRFARASEGTG